MNRLTLLILAAGEGKRIKPLLTSKPLLLFLGKTLLERVADGLGPLQPAQTIIVVNPKDKATVTKLLPQAKIMVQEKPTGMAGAVKAARRVLAGPAVVVNGDDLIDEKIITTFSQQIKKTPDKVVLTGIKSNLTGGYFNLQGEALKVVEKPINPPSPWFKIVLDYYPKIEEFTGELKDDYEAAVNQMRPDTMVKAGGEFYQLKFAHQVLDLTEFLLKQAVPDRSVIHPTAKIFPGAEVVRSYIGPKVVVGNHSLVRDSIIEAGCQIGFGTEIARSYIGPKNFCHTNYIGDSVIEGGSNFGAGAVLANFRFDHQPIGQTGRLKFGAVVGYGAQIGVNASLMPGASVPGGSLIGPGAVYK